METAEVLSRYIKVVDDILGMVLETASSARKVPVCERTSNTGAMKESGHMHQRRSLTQDGFFSPKRVFDARFPVIDNCNYLLNFVVLDMRV